MKTEKTYVKYKNPTLFIARENAQAAANEEQPVNAPALKELDFEVEMQPMYQLHPFLQDQVVELSPEFGSLLVRKDTGVCLSPVGAKYHPVQNNTLHDAVWEVLRTKLPVQVLQTVTFEDRSSYEGKFCRLEYTIRAMCATIPQTGGQHASGQMMIIVQNYHGQTSVRVKAAIKDTTCDNILVHGENGQTSSRHTASFDVAFLQTFVKDEIRKFAVRAQIIRDWAVTAITKSQFETLLKDSNVLNGTETLNALLEQFDVEASVRGSTIGAAYAAMTSWSSHANEFYVKNSTKVDNVAVTLASREDDVTKILDSDAFRSLSGQTASAAA